MRDNLQAADPFEDIFSQFFGGGGGGGGGRRKENKGPDLRLRLRAKLEDIYNGKEIKVSNLIQLFFTKLVICPHCRGSGADNPDDVKTCPDCNGTGHVVKRQQIAPGFFQQFQSACDKCNGKGKIFKKKCHVCRGAKIVPGSESIDIVIEKGVPNNHEIVY